MRIWICVIGFATGAALVLMAAPPAKSTPPAVSVPSYGGVPYQLLGQPGLSATDGKRIVELLESIDKRLELIEQKTGTAVGANLKKAPDTFAIAKLRCASCHTPLKAESKGGGFILFADDVPSALKPLSAREKGRVKESVQGGTMPPNTKLAPAERSAFEW